MECLSSFPYFYTHMKVMELAQNSDYFHGSMSLSSIQYVGSKGCGHSGRQVEEKQIG